MGTKVSLSYYVTVKTKAANGNECWIAVEKFDALAKAQKALKDPKFVEDKELLSKTIDITIKREEPAVVVNTTGLVCPHCTKMIEGEISFGEDEPGEPAVAPESAARPAAKEAAPAPAEEPAVNTDALSTEDEQKVQDMLDADRATEGEIPPPPPAANPAFPAQ